MTKNEVVTLLRNERRWLIDTAGKDILLTRTINGRAVTVRLEHVGLHHRVTKWKLIFPSYLFTSAISYFAPVEDEFRYCRDKKLLRALIKTLQRSAVWDVIINQQFLQLNKKNERITDTKRHELKEELKELGQF